MVVEVLIPTYRRPRSLLVCLAALATQTRSPDRVLVIAREDDQDTRAGLSGAELPAMVEIHWDAARGQVAQLNRGLTLLSGDVVAITDDDTIPDPDWIERIARRFADDDGVGAVGGPDWQRNPDPEHRHFGEVGRIEWFGRIVGAHHVDQGEVRDVDHLKGANMAFRTRAVAGLAFDSRLLGSGAQGSNDTAFSLAVRRRGWRLVFDPAVRVEHVPDVKFGEDPRDDFAPGAQVNHTHNSTLVVLDHLPWHRRLAFLLWSLLIGTRVQPGVLHLVLALLGRRPRTLPRYRATVVGLWLGWRRFLSSRRPG